MPLQAPRRRSGSHGRQYKWTEEGVYGMRFGGFWSWVREGQRGHGVSGVRFAKGAGLAVALFVVVLAFVPGRAWAEPVCTDTWTGPSEGEWATAANWSTGKAPSSTSVACIEAGKTIKVTEGTNQASVLEDKGTLAISGGSLELTSVLEVSSASTLTLNGGTLSGAGTLDVSGSLVWGKRSTMSGSGSTVVLSSASATFETSANKYLEQRSFVNEGTTTFSEGDMAMSAGATIKTSGTFKANSETAEAQFKVEPSGGSSPLIVNTGLFEKTAGTGKTEDEVSFENTGTLNASTGSIAYTAGNVAFASGSTLEGTIVLNGAAVTGGSFHAEKATVTLTPRNFTEGSLSINGSSTATIGTLTDSGLLLGAGTLDISSSLTWAGGSTMSGTGSTVILPSATATFTTTNNKSLSQRSFVNEGTTTFSEGDLGMSEGARLVNSGAFKASSESGVDQLRYEPKSGTALIVNTGLFEKTQGTGTTEVEVNFEDLGAIQELTGKLQIKHPVSTEPSTQYGGTENPSTPGQPHASCGDPVSCATGNFTETQTDLAVGGRGVGLNLTRTYNSQAGAEGTKGAFGYGWTSSFSDHLVVEKASKKAVLHQADGATVTFAEGSGESFTAPNWTQDTLSGTEAAGYTLTFANQTKYKFAGSSGRLESVTDRDGNATTLTYNEPGQLTTITDPVGRKIKLAYNGEGLIESAEDPTGHVVKYAYEAGNLKSVTQPAEAGLRWQFKYDGSHQMTEMTDGRGGKTVNEYNGSHQVTLQKDPAGHELSFEYEAFQTKITNKTTGSVTDEHFTSNDEPFSITHGFGTSSATTESFTYNEGGYLTSKTDGNGHTTKYAYNSANDRTSMVDPDKNETKWEYNTTHDVISTTTPKGETTTIKRDAHGNPEAIERPAPESKTQVTKYKYASTGELESVTNSLEHTWKYEYDAHGDRVAEIDPAGDKRSWEYNEDSQEIATVSPRGNVVGGRPAEFTTKTTRDAQGRPVAVTEQSGEFGYGFQIGTVGSENGQLKEPTGEVVTAGGNVDVVDRGNNRVEEFSAKGEYIGKFGSSGTSKGQFKTPYAIAIDSKGDLWVADEGNNRIQEFNEKHEAILMFGSEGTAGGQFKEPKSIAIAPNGNVYVSDAMNERVEQFNEKGEFLAAFGWGVSDGKSEFEICKSGCRAGLVGSGNGEFSQLRGVAVAANGNVWTADTINNRIEEFNEKNEYVSQFGVKGTGSGQLKEPKGIAIDAAGNVWVADSINNRVQEFTPSGGFLTTFGAAGTGNGQFAEPFGIAFAANGAAYIADIKNNRVEQWAPIAAVTEYKYDGDGNVEQVTDPNGHATKYTYNADNQPAKVEAPNKTITETEYDGAGQVVKQIDGNKHATKYARNVLEEVTEVTDPLGHVTKKEYDADGNLKKLEDPAKRTTTYTYDPANHLTEVVYSSGKPATVTYEYDKDGDRTKTVDGSGTTKYAYDQLDRLIESENGHKEIIKYEYDLGNEQTKITYPNGKAVTHAFDKDGRLEKVTDWNEKETKFSYDQNSNLEATTFPSATKGEDTYTHNDADQQTEVKMKKATETLASLAYTRDNDGQVKGITSKGLPGAEITENTYDENNRLTKYGATEYKYDSANNPTKEESVENKYNEGSQLEKGGTTGYSYDELGERTKATPEKGPVTTYGYDQADDLTSVERPEGESKPKIEDSYAYNGEGLRVSQTISGTTSYFAWDPTEGLPLLLSDGTNSYIYGPGGIPVEQINNTTGTVGYLHHDQAGSTRLITGSSGTVEGKCTYSAYGTPTCEGTATTPLGYDAQYTSGDTGLIYLRARTYDPATAQFLTVDPLNELTGAPYVYANDNPLNHGDVLGLSSWNPFSESFWTEGNFISESPLNPIPYYEKEIESYESGCGYFSSVTHGIEGAILGTASLIPVDDAELRVSAWLQSKYPWLTAKVTDWFARDSVAKYGQPGWAELIKKVVENIIH